MAQRERWALDHEATGVTYVNMDRDVRVKLLSILFGNVKELPHVAN